MECGEITGRLAIAALAWLVLPALAGSAHANDVQPRLFNNVPVGLNFLGISYVRSEGNVSVNPNLAVDVEAELNTLAVSYSRSFGIRGRSALFTAILPMADLGLTGVVLGQPASFDGSGISDPRFRLAVNLFGAPALDPRAYREYRQRTIIGVNLEVSPPFGEYHDNKLVNFGTNRWTVTPDVGFSHRVGRFTLEGAGGFSWFSDNGNYFGGQRLEQKILYSARAGVLYHLNRPGAWIGLGGAYFNGGETSVDGIERGDLQKSSRLGAAISIPFGRRHNVLFKYSSGITTRIGGDFDNYNLAYTLRF